LAQGQQSSFEAWLESFRKEAFGSGISQKTLDAAFTGLKPIPQVIELDRSQPEFKLTLKEYLHRVVSDNRITKGRKKLKENRPLLKRVAARYGLDPRFLVALWGIESDFGCSSGRFPVIGSLVTLAYDSRRSSFFRKELIHALRILDEGHMSIAQMKGSWAGAMGQLQFMPSTFRHFGLEYQKRLSVWQALGVPYLDGQDSPTQDLLSSIIQPDGPTGRTFLVYSNYHCLLKWNSSHNFAIAVGILSDRIGSLTELGALKNLPKSMSSRIDSTFAGASPAAQ